MPSTNATSFEGRRPRSEERGEAGIAASAGEPVGLTLQARDIPGLLAQRHGENFYGSVESGQPGA